MIEKLINLQTLNKRRSDYVTETFSGSICKIKEHLDITSLVGDSRIDSRK